MRIVYLALLGLILQSSGASIILMQSDTIISLVSNTSYSIDLNSSVSKIQYFQIYSSEAKRIEIRITPNSDSDIKLILDVSTRTGYNLKPNSTSYLKFYEKSISSSQTESFFLDLAEPGSAALGLESQGFRNFVLSINFSQYNPTETNSAMAQVAIFLTIAIVVVIFLIIGAIYFHKRKKVKKGTNESSTNPQHNSAQIQNGIFPQTDDILHQINQNDMNDDLEQESVHANNILVHDYQGSMTRMHNLDDDFDHTVPTIPDERTREQISVELCVICLEANKTILFEPCNHVAACQDCALKVLEIQSKCPLCREEIISIVPVA